MKKRKFKIEKEKYICIDTNIYLDYFRMSSETIDSLEELFKLLKKEKLHLLLPKQIKDEYLRKDKEEFIKSSGEEEKRDISKDITKEISEVNKKTGKRGLISLTKYFPEAKKLRKFRLASEKIINNLTKRVDEKYKEITRNKKRVEKLIEDIFKKAEFVDEKENIMQKAFYRYLKGNPPRKGDDKEKYGDAIIWKSLLEKFRKTKGCELVFITRDSDFDNDFLKQEWKNEIKSKISIVYSLGNFINMFIDQPVIKKEIIAEEKIQKEYPSSIASTTTISNYPLYGTVIDSTSGSTVTFPPSSSFIISPSNSLTSTSFASPYSYGAYSMPKYLCPLCHKDITSELNNKYGASFNYLILYKQSGIKLQCPICQEFFNLKDL